MSRKQIKWMVGIKAHDIHPQNLLAYITPTKTVCVSLQLFFLIKVLIGERQEAKFLAPGPLEYLPRQRGRPPIKIDSNVWIPHLPNSAHSCSQHGPGTSWLTSEWPGNITLAKNMNSDGSNFQWQGHAGSHCHTAKTGNTGRKAAR